MAGSTTLTAARACSNVRRILNDLVLSKFYDSHKQNVVNFLPELVDCYLKNVPDTLKTINSDEDNVNRTDRSEWRFDDDRAEIHKDDTDGINRTSNPKYGRDDSESCVANKDAAAGGSMFLKLRQASITRTGDSRSISVLNSRRKRMKL